MRKTILFAIDTVLFAVLDTVYHQHPPIKSAYLYSRGRGNASDVPHRPRKRLVRRQSGCYCRASRTHDGGHVLLSSDLSYTGAGRKRPAVPKTIGKRRGPCIYQMHDE